MGDPQMSDQKCSYTEHHEPLFQLTSFIGHVAQVAAKAFEIVLPTSSDPDARSARIGDFVLVQSGTFGMLGRVISLKLGVGESEKNVWDGVKEQVAVIEMLMSIDLQTETTYGGLVHSPAVGDEAFLAPADLIQSVVQGKRQGKTSKRVSLTFAELQNDEQTPLSFTPEQIFGRHCAVLGATGGGKSWTVARMVEECSRFNSKVILIDATGEYRDLENGIRHLSAGGLSPGETNARQVAVPYYHLTEGDLMRIFRPSGPSQGPRLRAAMKSLKLAQRERELAPDGTIIKAYKHRAPFEEAYKKHRKEIDRSLCNFDVRLLPRQVENECIDPQRSPTEPNIWGGSNGMDISNCMPMIARINDILSSPNLGVIFSAGKLPSLFNEIHDFLKDDSLRVLRISLEHFSFEYDAREIAVNAIGRHLLELARVGMFREKPLLVFVDEAHQFLNQRLSDAAEEFSLNAFSLLAKEGRKYSLNLCLATQRPRDIPEGVLSQIGTMIVHRVVNDQDRFVIERACGELDHNTAGRIPLLTPGEALIIGPDFGLPITVKIMEPEAKPHFEGPNYQNSW